MQPFAVMRSERDWRGRNRPQLNTGTFAMIVSRKHKFIFIKGKKVGGTSLEIALSKFLAATDIVTPIVPEDEAIREALHYVGPRNYRVPARQIANEVASLSGRGAHYLRKMVSRGEWPIRFANRDTAWHVRRDWGIGYGTTT